MGLNSEFSYYRLRHRIILVVSNRALSLGYEKNHFYLSWDNELSLVLVVAAAALQSLLCTKVVHLIETDYTMVALKERRAD